MEAVRETVDPDSGRLTEKKIVLARSFMVYNVDQVENIPVDLVTAPSLRVRSKEQRLDHFEKTIGAMGFGIQHSSAVARRALYTIAQDRAVLPAAATFRDREEYLGLLGHVAVHATAHPTRLNRTALFDRPHFGDGNYAREELVVAIATLMLAGRMEVRPVLLDDHSPYVHAWWRILSQNPDFLIKAASLAHRAVEYILQRQPSPELEPVPDDRLKPEDGRCVSLGREALQAGSAAPDGGGVAEAAAPPPVTTAGALGPVLPSLPRRAFPVEVDRQDAERQFCEFMRSKDIEPPKALVWNAPHLTYCRAGLKGKANRLGAYLARWSHGRGAKISVWNWRADPSRGFAGFTFASGKPLGVTSEEAAGIDAAVAARAERVLAARDSARSEAAILADRLMAAASPVTPENWYLRGKRVPPGPELREDENGDLLVPLRNIKGGLRNVLRISEKPSQSRRDNAFLAGGEIEGTFHLVGTLDPEGEVIITTGLAAGLAINALTGLPVAVAVTRGNLKPVAMAFRAEFSDCKISVAADNDHHLPRLNPALPNAGVATADAVAKIAKARVIIPRHLDELVEANEGTDWGAVFAMRSRSAAYTAWARSCARRPELLEVISLSKPAPKPPLLALLDELISAGPEDPAGSGPYAPKVSTRPCRPAVAAGRWF